MPRRGCDGFTLVEMLVVVAIISLLLALLLPVMNGAREIMRRVTCATNMRTLGYAAYDFSQDNEGRGPGSAHRVTPTSSSISWANILDTEVPAVKGKVQRMGTTPQPGKIYCPSMKPFNSAHPRAYMWNLDAAGGPGWGTDPYPYAKEIIPATERNSRYGRYHLGARLSLFKQPSFQILAIENERASDNYRATNTTPTAPTLGVDPAFPPFAGPGGQLAYRHQMLANYLHVDLSVVAFTPEEPVLDRRRFMLYP